MSMPPSLQPAAKLAARPATVISVAGLARAPGHAEALARLLAERERAPFAWGAQDCCLWAADAVHAQLGVDPAEQLRGRYATALQAQRLVHLCGGLEGIARAALGEPLRHASHACVGDVGLLASQAGAEQPPAEWPHMLAVCVGEWWAHPAAGGLALRPLQGAVFAWRVGCA